MEGVAGHGSPVTVMISSLPGVPLLLSPGNPVPAASVMGLPVFLFNDNAQQF